MPWTPANGDRLNFPYALWAKIARSSKVNHDDIMKALQESQRIHNAAVDMSNRIVELEAENRRLQHENEFMIRLVNDRTS